MNRGRAANAEAITAMTDYVAWLESLHPSHATLFAVPIDAAALRTRFRDAKYLEAADDDEPAKEIMARLNQGFMKMFNALFGLVTAPTLPRELRDHAWSIVAVNTFVLKIQGFGTIAEVLWRA